MKKTILFFAVLATVSFAQASDHWDSCSDASGSIRLENGELTIYGDAVVPAQKITVLRKIKEETQKCILQNHKIEVISLQNTITVEKVEYKYMDTDHTVHVICERGGSGIPANDSCRE